MSDTNTAPSRKLGRGTFRALLIALVAFVAAVGGYFASVPAGESQAGAGTIIALDFDPATPGVQSAATYPAGTTDIYVDVVVLNANPSGAFEFYILFDFIQIEFVDWTLGPFLGSTGRVVSCLQLLTENTVRIGCSSEGPAPPGPSGDGVLATLHFRPKLSVQACLTLLLVETADVLGVPYPTSPQSGCVTTVPGTATPVPTATRTATPGPSQVPATSTPGATETPRTSTPVPTEPPSGGTSTPSAATATPGGTATPGAGTATPAATATSAPPCPLSQGYWKEHPDEWPVASLSLGSQTYSKAELLALLDASTVGDASVLLAQQLIAAKLNIANGASAPAAVQSAITAADMRLATYAGKLPYGVNPSSTAGQQLVALASTLDQYNNTCAVAGAARSPANGTLGSGADALPGSGVGSSSAIPGSRAAQLITAMSLIIAVLLVVLFRQILRSERDEPADLG